MSVVVTGAGYRAADGYDEFVDSSGEVRPAWREFSDLIAGRGPGGTRPWYFSMSAVQAVL